nr:beta subunit of RNA polymerase [Oedogonium sp. 260-2_chl]
MKNILYIPIEYNLENYHRSNQDTCLVHRPIIKEGNWVQPGDLLADCSSSQNGELSIGQNILIAYMPWEGYNYEDAMLICDRLVYDEIYSSIHIEKYDVVIEDTPFGLEKITNESADLPGENLIHLDKNGIALLGSSVKEGDILVGKVTPTDKKVKYSNYEKLLYDILGTKKQNKGKDTSLRVPKGLEATVINIEIFSENLSFSLTNLDILSLANPLIFIQKGILQFLNLQTKKHLKPIKKFVEKKGLNKLSTIYSNLSFLQFIQTIMLEPSNKLAKSHYFHSNKKSLIGLNTVKFFLLPRSYYPLSDILRNSNFKILSNLINNYSKLEKKKNRIKQNIQDINLVSKHNFTKLKLQYRLSYFELFLFEILISTRNKKHSFLTKKIIDYIFQKAASFNSHDISLKNLIFKNNKTFSKNYNFIQISKIDAISKINFKQQRKKKAKKSYSISKKEGQLKKAGLTQRVGSALSLNFLNSKSFTIQIFLAEKRKIQVGDKIAGRHGNKGIVSQVLPTQDMPYLADGSIIDLVLNPLGVPSRMNVGQIYECLLGLSGYYLGEYYRILPFDEKVGEEASRSFVFSKLYEARRKTGYSWLFDPKNPGKTYLFDGRTGEKFEQQVTVGYAYILKLVHLVDDKIHSRSTGPYSAVTQQPLRGRSKQGGQRLGEMEVWALEGYGAAFTLLELLTIKSDDKIGRLTIWDSILRQKEISIKTPESFKVLICELKALCFDINILKKNK